MMPLVTGALGIGGPVGAKLHALGDPERSATWAGAVASAVDASECRRHRPGKVAELPDPESVLYRPAIPRVLVRDVRRATRAR